jgi:hypothetical protein
MRRFRTLLVALLRPFWQPRLPADPDKERVRREQREIAARLAVLEVEADWRGERRRMDSR